MLLAEGRVASRAGDKSMAACAQIIKMHSKELLRTWVQLQERVGDDECRHHRCQRRHRSARESSANRARRQGLGLRW